MSNCHLSFQDILALSCDVTNEEDCKKTIKEGTIDVV